MTGESTLDIYERMMESLEGAVIEEANAVERGDGGLGESGLTASFLIFRALMLVHYDLSFLAREVTSYLRASFKG